MQDYIIVNPDYAAMAAERLTGHGPLHDPGARIRDIGPGTCDLHMPISPAISQHAGFVHGGVIGALADAAGGFAAWTLLPGDHDVRTVEYKINFMRPASGAAILARARVIRPGRRLSVVQIDVDALDQTGKAKAVALMQQTITAIAP